MQKGRIEFDDPTFRPTAKPDVEPLRRALQNVIKTAEPFARVANIVDALPKRVSDAESFRYVAPDTWPTVGDARRLRDELVRLGWKP